MTNSIHEQIPRVGVAVIIIKDDTVLIGHRITSHGAGTWQFPGGHLEFGESLEECAIREVQEETGLAIINIKQAAFTNDIFETEQKHYVTLFMMANYVSGEPKVMEPEKCSEWKWVSWDELQQIDNLFLALKHLIEQEFSPFNSIKSHYN